MRHVTSAVVSESDIHIVNNSRQLMYCRLTNHVESHHSLSGSFTDEFVLGDRFAARVSFVEGTVIEVDEVTRVDLNAIGPELLNGFSFRQSH